MGWWGVLLEIVRVVVPHTAPHVAKAMAGAARERMAANEADRRNRIAADDMNRQMASLQQRLSAAEQRAADAEEQFAAMQNEFARKWSIARKWAIVLLVWNAVVSICLICLFLIRR